MAFSLVISYTILDRLFSSSLLTTAVNLLLLSGLIEIVYKKHIRLFSLQLHSVKSTNIVVPHKILALNTKNSNQIKVLIVFKICVKQWSIRRAQ